jgi:hypothetical protein
MTLRKRENIAGEFVFLLGASARYGRQEEKQTERIRKDTLDRVSLHPRAGLRRLEGY